MPSTTCRSVCWYPIFKFVLPFSEPGRVCAIRFHLLSVFNVVVESLSYPQETPIRKRLYSSSVLERPLVRGSISHPRSLMMMMMRIRGSFHVMDFVLRDRIFRSEDRGLPTTVMRTSMERSWRAIRRESPLSDRSPMRGRVDGPGPRVPERGHIAPGSQVSVDRSLLAMKSHNRYVHAWF